MIITELAKVFGPWQSLYSDSKVVPIVTQSVHLLALLFGGGFAVAADRASLRVSRDHARRASQLAELHSVHRPVLMALALAVLTGVGLAAADIEVFATSPVFGAKLAIVAVLLANGAVLAHTETQLRNQQNLDMSDSRRERLWRRLRLTSWLSLALWSAALIAGVVLVNVA
jgi:hypothetical protein